MEPSAPFMHVVLGCQGSSLGPRSATRPPACSSRLQQSLSRLFPFSLRKSSSLHLISAAPAAWKSLRCQESLSPRLVITENSRADCSRLFPRTYALLGFI